MLKRISILMSLCLVGCASVPETIIWMGPNEEVESIPYLQIDRYMEHRRCAPPYAETPVCEVYGSRADCTCVLPGVGQLL